MIFLQIANILLQALLLIVMTTSMGLVIWYSWETRRLRFEAEKSRKVTFMPIIKFGRDDIRTMSISNVGYGPAFNLRVYRYEPEPEAYYAPNQTSKFQIVAVNTPDIGVSIMPSESVEVKRIIKHYKQHFNLLPNHNIILALYEDCLNNQYATCSSKRDDQTYSYFSQASEAPINN